MRGASAPDLLHLQAAADRDVADADDRGALRRRDRRGLRLAALELDDVGVDAALLEIAQRLGHVGRGVHHVRRRHRHADVDLAHRRAVRGLREGGAGHATAASANGMRRSFDGHSWVPPVFRREHRETGMPGTRVSCGRCLRSNLRLAGRDMATLQEKRLLCAELERTHPYHQTLDLGDAG